MKIKTRSQVHCTEEKELVSDPYKFDFTVIGLNPIVRFQWHFLVTWQLRLKRN